MFKTTFSLHYATVFNSISAVDLTHPFPIPINLLNMLRFLLTSNPTAAESLQQDIEDEQARTEEIDKLKRYMETDEYAEEVARERLGLVKDNETVFKKEQ